MKCRAELKRAMKYNLGLRVELASIQKCQPDHPDNDDIEEVLKMLQRLKKHLEMRESELTTNPVGATIYHHKDGEIIREATESCQGE